MLFKIKVTNTEALFRMHIMLKDGTEVYSCNRRGGEFRYKGKRYAVLAPFYDHMGLEEHRFRVYELVPVSEASDDTRK